MNKIAAVALMALAGTVEAAKLNLVQQSEAVSTTDAFRPEENSLCMADADGEEGGFDTNVAGLYESSDVRLLDGRDAKKVLIKGDGFDKPMLVVAYHPQCPHCHTMVTDFKQLAHELKEKKIPVELAAINMSMEHTSDKLGIDAFPTLRFYTKASEFSKYHDPAGRHYAGFKHFLQAKGFKLE